MNELLFAVTTEATNSLVERIFRGLPVQERERIQSSIAAVTDDYLPTAVRPFMFGGKVVHELYLDPEKLRFFVKHERIGAIVSAFIIASLAQESKQRIEEEASLFDQVLWLHRQLVLQHAKRWRYAREVSAFLNRLKILEDEWRESAFPSS